MPCFASCCLRIASWLIVSPFACVLALGRAGRRVHVRGPVEYIYEDQAYVNSENFAGKMTIPSKSLLSLLARCSLFCYAYATIPTTCFIMPPILPCQTSNPPCPSKLLFGYVTALLSPSYSVASCRWRLEFVPCWNMFIVGISLYYLVYFNASIYLVKDGRLVLMPGVLFHSCRPSFRHTGVMFLDFVFLTWLGYNGNPLTVCFE